MSAAGAGAKAAETATKEAVKLFPKIRDAAARLWGSTKGLGSNAAAAVKTTGTAVTGSATTLADGTTKVTGGIVDSLGAAVMVGVRAPIAFVSGMFAKAPVITTLGTAAIGTTAIAGAVRGGAERRTRKEMLQQAAATQQGNPYKISEADAAALEARMKQGGQNGGFAAAELAARNDQGQAATR